MMRTPNQARRLFAVLFASFFLISIIPMGIMGVTWLSADTTMMNHLDTNNQTLIRQMQETIDNRIHEVSAIHSQIYANQLVRTLMYTSVGFTGNNIIRARQLINEMNVYCSMSDFVDDVFVYFSGMDIIVTKTTTAMPDMFYRVFFGDQMEYSQYMEILHNPHHTRAIQMVAMSDGTRYGCVCYSLPIGKNGMTLGTICLMIKEEKLLALIDPISRLYAGGIACVRMEGGELLTSSGMLNADHAEEKHVQVVPNEYLSVFEAHGNEVCLETEDQDQVYHLIAMVDRTEVFNSAMRLRVTFFVALAISFVLTLGIAVALSYYTYKPLREIAREVDRTATSDDQPSITNPLAMMESGVREISNQNKQLKEIAVRSRQVLRISFINQLLSGVYNLDQAGFMQDCEKFNVDLTQQYFCVMVIHVDLKQSTKDENEQREVWYILSDIVECFDDNEVQHSTSVANFDSNCLFVILNAGTPEELQVRETAESIKQMIETGYPAFATVGIGTIESGFTHIDDSRINAQYALDYRMVAGISSIIEYDTVPKGDNDSIYFEYISEMDNRLVTAARAGDEEKAVQLIGELFDRFIEQLPMQTIRCLVYDMTITVIRMMSSLNISQQAIFGMNDPVEYLGNCETIEICRERFACVYQNICCMVDSKKRSHNNGLRQAVEDFILQHYADESLSQQMIADEFGRSANYLSYFFREQTGEKMSTYISNVRVEQAQRLLRTTELSVKDIAQQTGFGSDLNFIRVFKKVRGMTPGQYRKGSEKDEIEE